jgi:hypothetical protein
VSGKVYAVDNGVWFVASGPQGPWAVADSVPEDEIVKIPPSSPAYNVTYVHVYQSTPQVVYVGYTPGYLWSFPYYGVPVYGTGYYYRPYPAYYYPRPYTYGLHVGYNPWTGWNFGVSWGVGFMHYGVGWGGGYRYGYRYGCCGGWYGGYRPGWGGSYHYSRSSSTHVSIGNSVNFGNQTRAVASVRNKPNAGRLRNESLYNQTANRARNADRATVRRGQQTARASQGRNNDVLADRDGNVVRRTPEGLQTREGGKWQAADGAAARDRAKAAAPPAARERAGTIDRDAVQRDYSARQRGAQRERSSAQVPKSRPSRAPAPRTPPSAAAGARRR